MKMTLTDDHHQALRLLAGSADACTVPTMLAQGCTIRVLRYLVRRRLAVPERERVHHARHAVIVTRLRITDAGLRTLAERI